MSVEGEQRNLEARVGHLEVGMSETNRRIAAVEKGVNDIAVSVAELHGDMKAAAVETRNVNGSVQEIRKDTRNMVAMWEATPRMQSNARFWVWLVGTFAATVMTLSTAYMAFLK
jgi:hypothetical protein